MGRGNRSDRGRGRSRRSGAAQESRSPVDISAKLERIGEDAADAGDTVSFDGPRDILPADSRVAGDPQSGREPVKYGRKAAVTLTPEPGRVAVIVGVEVLQ